MYPEYIPLQKLKHTSKGFKMKARGGMVGREVQEGGIYIIMTDPTLMYGKTTTL